MSRRTKYKSSRRKAIRGSVARRTHSRKGPRRSTQFKQSKRTRVSRGSVRAHRSTLSYLNKKRRGGSSRSHYRDEKDIEYMRALQRDHQLGDPTLVEQAMEGQSQQRSMQEVQKLPQDFDIEYMRALQKEHQLGDATFVDQAMEEQSQQRSTEIEYMKNLQQEHALLEELHSNRTTQHIDDSLPGHKQRVPEKPRSHKFSKRMSDGFKRLIHGRRRRGGRAGEVLS